MLSFKFLLNSIWYLPFSIGELAKQQTRETNWLSQQTYSMGMSWPWEGGETLRKALLLSDTSLVYLPVFQVSLGTDNWRQCLGNSSQEIIFSMAIYNYTCTVPFQSPWAGSVLWCIFPSALVSNDLPLGCYLWCWRKILSLSFYSKKRNQSRSVCVEYQYRGERVSTKTHHLKQSFAKSCVMLRPDSKI